MPKGKFRLNSPIVPWPTNFSREWEANSDMFQVQTTAKSMLLVWPNLCYWCGRLTHDNKDCEIWIDSEGTLKPEDRQFGPGLQAPTFVQTRKTRLTVPGFYTVRKKSKVSPSPMDANNSAKTG